MISYSFKILRNQPLRTTLMICGTALCVVLMLFLIGVYKGVADGSMEYIRKNRTDLWVLQKNTWNILRGSSILGEVHGMLLRRFDFVESASPVLLLLPGVRSGDDISTVFLAGYDLHSGTGGPPAIVEGRPIASDDEIIVDRAFAVKSGIALGRKVTIQDDSLTVVGFSSGTNAFVIQYAFVSISRARSIAGVPGLTSTYLVRLKPGTPADAAMRAIREDVPGIEVYDHATFLANNKREMEAGFLPLLFVIAAISAIVLTAILSLLLSISILEKRKDFAIMKTLGSPGLSLVGMIIQQAVIIVASACVVALILFSPLCAVVGGIWPAMSPQSTPAQVLTVLAVCGIVSVISSLVSVQKLRHIYPLEAFS